MMTTQRLPSSLTPLEAALALLLDGLSPVVPVELPLPEVLGCVAADNPPLRPFPVCDVAAVDGFAFAARNLIGASSYSPLPLTLPPVWVEAGDAMPHGCDCVLDSDLVEWSGPLAQVVAEAIPGQGVRRAGEDIGGARAMPSAGQPLRPLDLLAARMAGLQTRAVRRPRVLLINVPTTTGNKPTTAPCIAELAEALGASVKRHDATARDAGSIAQALGAEPCDLVITVGGTGVGRSDAAIEALALRGKILGHGIALAPGRTTAIGSMAGIPVVALPGAPDQALAAWWTLALPALDRLSARQPRPPTRLPLVRKIASSVGISEIAVLKLVDDGWMPLASAYLSLDAIAGADAWLAIPADSEGYAAGTPVAGYILRDRMARID